LMTLLLIVPLLQIVPVASQAKMSCKQVVALVTRLIAGEGIDFYDPWEQIVKVHTLTLNNKGCFDKKGINAVLKELREVKVDCENAKKDEIAWEMEKAKCTKYQKLYKYIK